MFEDEVKRAQQQLQAFRLGLLPLLKAGLEIQWPRVQVMLTDRGTELDVVNNLSSPEQCLCG